jgi:hypothetical protein
VSVDALIGLNSTRLDKIALPRKRAARERKIGLLVVSLNVSQPSTLKTLAEFVWSVFASRELLLSVF